MEQPVQEASKTWLVSVSNNASRVWREDLESLFLNAKNRFPDVVWETKLDTIDAQNPQDVSGEVWGHRALVNARISPADHDKYLPNSYDSSPTGDDGMELASLPPSGARTWASFRRFKTSFHHRSLLDELRILYTIDADTLTPDYSWSAFDSGVISVFNRLSCSLRRDLLFMWRTPTYSDVEITVHNISQGDMYAVGVLLAHRFILSSRSPYFNRILVSSQPSNSYQPNYPFKITLPYPSFTLVSLKFIVGYLYTGTLKFTTQKIGLLTALAILKGAIYLELPDLQDLIVAQIAVETLHGLYYANLCNNDYLRLTGGDWRTMGDLGCRCPSCALSAPIVLRFLKQRDIENEILERGAHRAFVGLFGEGWCTNEFAALPLDITEVIIVNVFEMITPSNIFPLLFAAESALLKVSLSVEPWAVGPRSVKPSITVIRESIEQFLCANPRACFDSKAWKDILCGTEDQKEKDRIGIRDEIINKKAVEVGWIMNAITRNKNHENASTIYSTLVFSTDLDSQCEVNSPVRAMIRGALVELSEAMQFSPAHTEQIPLAKPSELEMISQEGEFIERFFTTHSSASTIYSYVTAPESVPSIIETIDDLNISEYNLSINSCASSRTNSTDYGLFHSRMAISRDTLEQDVEASWDL